MGVVLLSSGCFSLPRIVTIIQENDQGKVYLKEFHNYSSIASHPVTLDPLLVRKIFMGVRVHERKTGIESTLTGSAAATPAFTHSEIEFLTPAVVAAFQHATPGEAVHFQINGDISGKRFDTGGFMFVKEDSLNLTINQYGISPQQPATLSQPTKSFDRPKRWSVTFSPIGAVLNPEDDKQVMGDNTVTEPLLLSLSVLQKLESVPDEDNSILGSSNTALEGDRQSNTRMDGVSSTPSQEETEAEIQRLRKSMKEQEERLKRLEQRMGK